MNRLENKVNDSRLDFFLGEKSKNITFEETLQPLLGYPSSNEFNVTVIDLSGVPFEVLSITVPLISRLVFEYEYIYKRLRCAKEGRKYGVTLLLTSQRLSEISETFFSQCNNFIAMCLTNPVDKGYVTNVIASELGLCLTGPNLLVRLNVFH